LRRAFHAVDAHAREARSEAAHGNVAAFASIAARQRHAGDSLHRFGKIAVRKLANVFRDDAVDRRRLFALLCERRIQRFTKTSDDDLVELFIGAVGFLSVRHM
jgi:hypothetical protein